MATSVQILCPNGRRQNVKVTPNTKLMQVLEEVCTKQVFLPFEDYDLIHGRKTLDLTLSFRFSTLPNNAKLELVKSSSPRSLAEGEVTIALQLESGERLQHAFHCTTTLWEILSYWESQNEICKGCLTNVDSTHSPPLHPVCIYMREEVTGEAALKDTTLKKLALTSGKAIIRFIHNPVTDSALAEIINKIEQEKAKRARLLQKAQQTEQAIAALPLSARVSAQSSSVDQSQSGSSTAAASASQEEKMIVEESVGQTENKTLKSDSSQANVTVAMETESVDKEDLKAAPSKPCDGTGTTSSETKALARQVPGAGQGGAEGPNAIEQLRRMNIPGVDIITPNDFNNLSPEQQQVARLMAERLMPGLFGGQSQGGTNAGGANPKPKKAPSRPPFADFKFPEATKGQNLYHNELSEVKPEEYMPCERETVIFNNNEENTRKAVPEDPSEDFFEVTDLDVKSLYRDLQKQVSSERPLMTEAMRQAELEEKYNQYRRVVMRVQFADGLVIQGCFRPRETVFALHKYVREHLEDKEQDFYLYRTPPKQVLSDMTKTLVQADLAPASLLYFGSDKKEDHSLLASARTEIAPKRRADEVSVKILAKRQMESMSLGNDSPHASNTSVSSSSSRAGGGVPGPDHPKASVPRTAAAAGGEPKVPKWMKLGKK